MNFKGDSFLLPDNFSSMKNAPNPVPGLNPYICKFLLILYIFDGPFSHFSPLEFPQCGPGQGVRKYDWTSKFLEIDTDLTVDKTF